MFADAKRCGIEVPEAEIHAGVACGAAGLVAVSTVVVQVGARSLVERASGGLAPFCRTRSCGGRGRPVEVAQSGPSRELICGPVAIRKILVQIARLGADGLQELVVVMALAALIGVRNLIRKVVCPSSRVPVADRNGIGNQLQRGLSLAVVP